MTTTVSELTRKLLGSRAAGDADASDETDSPSEDDGPDGGGQWVAYAPLACTTFTPNGGGSTLAIGFQHDDEETRD